MTEETDRFSRGNEYVPEEKQIKDSDLFDEIISETQTKKSEQNKEGKKAESTYYKKDLNNTGMKMTDDGRRNTEKDMIDFGDNNSSNPLNNNVSNNNNLNQNNNEFQNNNFNHMKNNEQYKNMNMNNTNQIIPSKNQNILMNNQMQNNPNNFPKGEYKKKSINMNINPNNDNMSNQAINNIIEQGNNISNNNINNQNNPNININHNIPSKQQIDNPNPNQMFNSPSFAKKYQATKTGLINLVEASYLNAVLQLIGSFKFFGSYFLNKKHSEEIYEDIPHKPLSFVIQRLFLHLYPEKNKEGKVKFENYKPQSIKQILGQLNPIYNSKNRRNPNDLLSFILNTLHKELNEANKTKKNNNSNNTLIPNNNDRNDVINTGIKNFANLYSSIISNNLNWFEVKQSICQLCNNNLFHFNIFNIFELDILRTYEKRNKIITIEDCLEYYTEDKFQKLICQKCGQKSKITNKTSLYSSPNIFIFYLDRQNLDNRYLQIPFKINEEINISNFLEKKETPSQYKLTGILSYMMNQKKYISFCMSPNDNKWYVYNDEKIESIEITNVININQLIPCILVYKSK